MTLLHRVGIHSTMLFGRTTTAHDSLAKESVQRFLDVGSGLSHRESVVKAAASYLDLGQETRRYKILTACPRLFTLHPNGSRYASGTSWRGTACPDGTLLVPSQHYARLYGHTLPADHGLLVNGSACGGIVPWQAGLCPRFSCNPAVAVARPSTFYRK